MGDPKLVVLFGFKTKFGGGKSTGFCRIYDNEDSMRKFEPKNRLVKQGVQRKKHHVRRSRKLRIRARRSVVQEQVLPNTRLSVQVETIKYVLCRLFLHSQ